MRAFATKFELWHPLASIKQNHLQEFCGTAKRAIFILMITGSNIFSATVLADSQRGIKNYEEYLAGRKTLEQLSRIEMTEVLAVHNAQKLWVDFVERV
jgi:hypothetical protein